MSYVGAVWTVRARLSVGGFNHCARRFFDQMGLASLKPTLTGVRVASKDFALWRLSSVNMDRPRVTCGRRLGGPEATNRCRSADEKMCLGSMSLL